MVAIDRKIAEEYLELLESTGSYSDEEKFMAELRKAIAK